MNQEPVSSTLLRMLADALALQKAVLDAMEVLVTLEAGILLFLAVVLGFMVVWQVLHTNTLSRVEAKLDALLKKTESSIK